MAGLGRKVFTAGEVLTAANVQGYLMDQTVMVFAGTAARASAIATATEGMVSYLSDTNTIEKYTGAAWENIAAGVTGGTAGQAYISGGTASPAFGKLNQSFTSTTVSSLIAPYTATATDANTVIRASGTVAYTITFPDLFQIGDRVDIIRDNPGTVTLAAGTGVFGWAGAGTAGTAVTFKMDQQYNAATVVKVADQQYRVIGKITV